MVGFDLIKYMQLILKSNPTSIEWLNSYIIYYGTNNLPVKEYIMRNFNPKTLIYHYISLCKKHYNRYINENKKVTHKMYLYMMRGLLNALFVYMKQEIPPNDFTKTLEFLKAEIPQNVYETVKEIIRIKSYGFEQDKIARIKILDEFIAEYMNKSFDTKERKFDIKILDDYLYKEILGDNNARNTR